FLPRGELLEDRVPPGTLLSLLAGPWPNLDLSPAEMIPLPEWSEPSWVNPLDQVPAGGTAGTSSAPAPVHDPAVNEASQPDVPDALGLPTPVAEGGVGLEGGSGNDKYSVPGTQYLVPSTQYINDSALGTPYSVLGTRYLADRWTEAAPLPERQDRTGPAGVVPASPTRPGGSQFAENYGRLPLSFIANQGQADAQVQFMAGGSGYPLFLTGREAMLSLRNPAAPDGDPTATAFHMQVIGARPGAHAVGREELPGKVNYFLGNDPAQWQRDIPAFA